MFEAGNGVKERNHDAVSQSCGCAKAPEHMASCFFFKFRLSSGSTFDEDCAVTTSSYRLFWSTAEKRLLSVKRDVVWLRHGLQTIISRIFHDTQAAQLT